MVVTMMNFQDRRQSVLVVVIGPENLARMQKGDPLTLVAHSEGGFLKQPLYPENLSMVVAYEADPFFTEHAVGMTHADLLQYLARGYKYEPEKGDGIDLNEL